MITVVTVPGIGEPLSPDGTPLGLLEYLTRHLSSEEFICRQFNYRNQYGPAPTWNGTAYDINLHNAVRELATLIEQDPNEVILVGYSAGAHVISNLLNSIHAGMYPTLVIRAVALVANPVMARGEGVSDLRLYGVAGEHGPWPDIPVYHLANPNDIIPCSEENSPIRGFSDISRSFSFTDPWHWIAAYIDAARNGKNQNWWNPFARGAWERALVGGIGYLNGSQHVRWYLEGDRLRQLAEVINESVVSHR